MGGSRIKEVLTALVFIVLLAMLVFSGIKVYNAYTYEGPIVDTGLYPVRGIDISRHNGKVDFKKVKDAGMEFVFIKASEGVTHTDSLFARNIDEARLAGLKTGAYHFFRFDKDGVDQALNFLHVLGGRQPELGLVVDVEQAGNPAEEAKEVKRRLSSMVEYLNLMGYRVTLYSNLDGYHDYLKEDFSEYPLWICRFKDNPIDGEWTFWQYDHHGRVDGVKGEVDMNTFNGTREEWDAFLVSS